MLYRPPPGQRQQLSRRHRSRPQPMLRRPSPGATANDRRDLRLAAMVEHPAARLDRREVTRLAASPQPLSLSWTGVEPDRLTKPYGPGPSAHHPRSDLTAAALKIDRAVTRCRTSRPMGSLVMPASRGL